MRDEVQQSLYSGPIPNENWVPGVMPVLVDNPLASSLLMADKHMQAFGAELVMGTCHGSITLNVRLRVCCRVERQARYRYTGKCRISDLTSIGASTVMWRRSSLGTHRETVLEMGFDPDLKSDCTQCHLLQVLVEGALLFFGD